MSTKWEAIVRGVFAGGPQELLSDGLLEIAKYDDETPALWVAQKLSRWHERLSNGQRSAPYRRMWDDPTAEEVVRMKAYDQFRELELATAELALKACHAVWTPEEKQAWLADNGTKVLMQMRGYGRYDYDRQLAGITVAEVLAELATRPHMPNKLEGKKARQLASPAGRRKLKREATLKQKQRT